MQLCFWVTVFSPHNRHLVSLYLDYISSTEPISLWPKEPCCMCLKPWWVLAMCLLPWHWSSWVLGVWLHHCLHWLHSYANTAHSAGSVCWWFAIEYVLQPEALPSHKSPLPANTDKLNKKKVPMTDSKLALAARQIMAAVQAVLNGDVWPTALNALFSHKAGLDRIHYAIVKRFYCQF